MANGLAAAARAARRDQRGSCSATPTPTTAARRPALGVPVFCHPDDRADAEGDGGVHYFDLSKLDAAGALVDPRLLPVWDGGPVADRRAPSRRATTSPASRSSTSPATRRGRSRCGASPTALALSATASTRSTRRPAARARRACPTARFNYDTEQARASIRKLAALEPAAAWPGHADPVTGDVRAQLEHAAADDLADGHARSRRRGGAEQLDARRRPPYAGAGATCWSLRGAMTPGRARSTRGRAPAALQQEDAWQRAVEFLFERLAVRWTVAATCRSRARRRCSRASASATRDERAWIRDVLREHLAEHFPDVEAP